MHYEAQPLPIHIREYINASDTMALLQREVIGSRDPWQALCLTIDTGHSVFDHYANYFIFRDGILVNMHMIKEGCYELVFFPPLLPISKRH